MILPVGIYLCDLVDAGCSESSSGDIQVFVKFKNSEGEITDFMSFNGGAKKITLESIIKLGLKGELDDISNKGAQAFDTDRKYEVCVGDREYNGKSYRCVKWFNAEGDSLTKRMETTKAKSKLSAFKGDLMAMGHVPQKEVRQATLSSENIPF